MKLIVCLDDNKGMTFNYRRQSRDRIVSADIKEETSWNVLFVSEYTSKMIDGVIVDQNKLLDCIGDDDFLFAEDINIEPYISAINKIIVYWWNRVYPADRHFPIDLTTDEWNLIHEEEFPGYSHGKITKQIFERVKQNEEI